MTEAREAHLKYAKHTLLTDSALLIDVGSVLKDSRLQGERASAKQLYFLAT